MTPRSRTDGQPAVLALVGPTAAGKSDLALDLARRGIRGREVEIVSADAFNLYRGMDVGTAKPPPEVRAEITHHLVDVLDPSEEASVAWFQSAARAAIDTVRSRGRVPLLVGGSGLYVRAAVDDLRFPPTDPDLRRRLLDIHRPDPAAAHRVLTRVDPDAASRIDPLNLRRTVRALEVIELTGEPFSSFATSWAAYEPVYSGLEIRGIDLPNPQLRRRITARAEAMVEAGLLEEAARLRQLPGPLSSTAAQAIGYAEAFAVLDGELPGEELAGAIATRTWRYAKRQRSWFRRDPRVVWTDRDEVLADWAG